MTRDDAPEPVADDDLARLADTDPEEAAALDFGRLEAEFHEAMLDLYRRTKSEVRYTATYFLQSVQREGGRETVRALLHAGATSSGFTELYLHRRLDLTVEAVVVDNPRFWPLFTDVDLDVARRRLLDHGYEVTPRS